MMQKWNLEMVILIWMFHGKCDDRHYLFLLAVLHLSNFMSAFKHYLLCISQHRMFLMFISINENAGNGGLVNHLPGNMLLDQKQHRWILWCVPNLKLILMKLEPVLNKLYKISAVRRLVFLFI